MIFKCVCIVMSDIKYKIMVIFSSCHHITSCLPCCIRWFKYPNVISGYWLRDLLLQEASCNKVYFHLNTADLHWTSQFNAACEDVKFHTAGVHVKRTVYILVLGFEGWRICHPSLSLKWPLMLPSTYPDFVSVWVCVTRVRFSCFPGLL